MGLIDFVNRNIHGSENPTWWHATNFEKVDEDDDEASETGSLKRPFDTQITRRASRNLFTTFMVPAMVHCAIFAIYTIAFLHHARTEDIGISCTPFPTDIVKSPANSAVDYEAVVYNATLCIPSPYVGPPGPEVDKAWSDLVQYSHIKVSGEDLRRINKTSIAIPGEEDAYWGTLGVTHEIHCLKRLRQYFYKDHYFPNLSGHQLELNALHTGHCLEVLRQAVMCHGDTSIITMYWKDDIAIPVADFSVPHQCVNWDHLSNWAKEHTFDPMKPNFLQHPTLGAAFPDGTNGGIGVAEHFHHEHDGADAMTTGIEEAVPENCHA